MRRTVGLERASGVTLCVRLLDWARRQGGWGLGTPAMEQVEKACAAQACHVRRADTERDRVMGADGGDGETGAAHREVAAEKVCGDAERVPVGDVRARMTSDVEGGAVQVARGVRGASHRAVRATGTREWPVGGALVDAGALEGRAAVVVLSALARSTS